MGDPYNIEAVAEFLEEQGFQVSYLDDETLVVAKHTLTEKILTSMGNVLRMFKGIRKKDPNKWQKDT